ncbi:histidine phosphatase family protein [Bdellovibrio sp. HCB274]|uniref:histidine phosphatase family protein n=1 Tax=Bdellovibrio sp. HCB274 TaxID=3394361 RepID=UPI0039B541C7
MTKTIYLFRHGQTEWNLIRRMQGHSDIPLNDEGRKQAQQLQNFFKSHPVEVMFSSDLMRAQQTAAIANEVLSAPTFVSEKFREVFLGDIEGMTQEEIKNMHGEESWLRWTSHEVKNFSFTYGNGESALVAIERFKNGLLEVCQSQSFAVAGLCTHGLMLKRFLHSLRPDLLEPLPIPNCVVYRVDWSPTRGFEFAPELTADEAGA